MPESDNDDDDVPKISLQEMLEDLKLADAEPQSEMEAASSEAMATE